MNKLMCLVFVALIVMSVPLTAEEPVDLKLIVEQQRSIATKIDKSRDAMGLTTYQIGLIRKAQAEIFTTAKGKRSLSELTVDEQVRLKNALGQIDATLQDTRLAQDQQEVCWREKKTGSKIYVTRCATQEEILQAREGARAWMERPRVCIPPGCG